MSPLRKLVKAHSDDLISDQEYKNIRTLLLDKLEQSGEIKDHDLDNFLNLKNISVNNQATTEYPLGDIIIIALGILATATLAYILYS